MVLNPITTWVGMPAASGFRSDYHRSEDQWSRPAFHYTSFGPQSDSVEFKPFDQNLSGFVKERTVVLSMPFSMNAVSAEIFVQPVVDFTDF
jgi:hypothetical protein